MVETDVSYFEVGDFLSQKDSKGRFHRVQFASRTMNQAETLYSVSEEEALSVTFAFKKFRVYPLSDKKFTLFTDHQATRTAFQ